MTTPQLCCPVRRGNTRAGRGGFGAADGLRLVVTPSPPHDADTSRRKLRRLPVTGVLQPGTFEGCLQPPSRPTSF